MTSVLLVEDDPVVRAAITRALTGQGHIVHGVALAIEALREVTANKYDVVVLDLGLPDLDGGDALRMIRGVTNTPVVIATARDDEAEIIRLLNAGADDYLVKPFSSEHLEARLQAVLRRARDSKQLVIGGLEIDVNLRRATVDGQELSLTHKEFELLSYLAARQGEVVPRAEILASLWPSNRDDQTLDVHLSWLRRKLGERAAQPRYLHTVRGVGVRMVAPQ
ncbi:DNA-binding response regulator, OmpR family, contains REC and winged-helix (wHTH) domain [Lentzea waywayandensis]|uniref:DNA-binding response regulator, OmpR family, contains REC and winged-helix (WHTH) domain n=1 Tax=Lentzea waywayandensis TaxID=84724 RepID=A0A1I6FE73_9PSEU|nr:response regulator transcription factor [Lentzea waywayandensis]SFR28208.1 DNA-binding response regulator, OmpR family, contains REC and winged-helix (wHTH) domain [Lentzea waywayandensis]